MRPTPKLGAIPVEPQRAQPTSTTCNRPVATRDGIWSLPFGGGATPCAAKEHSGARGFAPQSAPSSGERGA